MADVGSEVLGVRHSVVAGGLPAGACDCHTHVFDGSGVLDAGRAYTPRDALVSDLVRHQAALGLSRVVVVQPSAYSTENGCTMGAVAALNAAGKDRARAVVVVGEDWGTERLRALHDGGARGVRLNLETTGRSDPGTAPDLVRRAADQVRALGWHVQVYTRPDVVEVLERVAPEVGVPLVFDHFGRIAGPGEPGFGALEAMVRAGHAYVKLSGPHRVAKDPEAAAHALIAANPARMLWGSDWPHLGAHPVHEGASVMEDRPFEPIDDGAALGRLRGWAGNGAMLARILVENPARLYGFAA